MRIRDLLDRSRPFLSMEFFPPKERDAWEEFFSKIEGLKALSPLFVSITCGAGGTVPVNTLEIASRLKNEYALEPMPHLTCIGGTCGDLASALDEMQRAGIHNVMALRGDPPREPEAVCAAGDFRYASDLVRFIRERHPEMGIGVAGYPEAHPESPSIVSDLHYLQEKLDSGADFLITQFFFDNRVYFEFARRLKEMGIDKPVIPGVLPVLSLRSLRYILRISGGSIPGRLYLELEDADRRGGAEEVRRIGVRHAREQIRSLLQDGAPGIHLYTLNNAAASEEIVEGLFPG